jgi:hypothetical protein
MDISAIRTGGVQQIKETFGRGRVPGRRPWHSAGDWEHPCSELSFLRAVMLRARLLSRTGVSIGVDQLLDANTSINLRGIELFMPENGLKSANVGAAIVHQRGHGVTVDVAGARLVDACRLDVPPQVAGRGFSVVLTTVIQEVDY